MKKSRKEREWHIRDILSRMKDENLAALASLKDSLIVAQENKHWLRALGKARSLNSACTGEYRIIHAAIAYILMTQVEPLDGTHMDTLQRTSLAQFHGLTRDYYRDYPQKEHYLKKLYSRILTELIEDSFLSARGSKVIVENYNPVDLVTSIYGRTLTHGTGISSWKRALMLGILTQHPGASKQHLFDVGKNVYEEPLLKKKDPDKLLLTHGPVDGSGFLVFDVWSGLWRTYDRITDPTVPQLSGRSEQERNGFEKTLKLIQHMPFLSETAIINHVGRENYQLAREIAASRTNNVLTKVGASFVSKKDAINLKLVREDLRDMDSITKVQRMWDKALELLPDPKDAGQVVRYFVNTLLKDGSYKPTTNVEGLWIEAAVVPIGLVKKELSEYRLVATRTDELIRLGRFGGMIA